jgi:hypothetical protein
MNIALTKVARRLQLAIKYLLVAVEATDDGVDVSISESLFRGLCLAGDAFSTLQVERFTTPSTRRRIQVSTTDSQIPLVVQKAQKDLFFRSGAGAKRATSPSPEESDESLSDIPMRKKKRDAFIWGRRRFLPRQRRNRRPVRRRYDSGKYFQARPRWKFTDRSPRRWEPRATAPPAPP